ncbi:hypothetical protein CRENBAI_013347 [Crenichthys baileyi]|uniref:Uncharacterized protein n=1 Tax=Crenichthys baileyi TaxID=28760 RepID=A0AAV9QZP4_9TELE
MGEEGEVVEEYKNLGVYLDNRLKWRCNCETYKNGHILYKPVAESSLSSTSLVRMCPGSNRSAAIQNQSTAAQTVELGEHEDHTDQTMKVLVIHNPLAEEDPAKVSVVIEGNKVLNGCGKRTKACRLLMGLIYGLNL